MNQPESSAGEFTNKVAISPAGWPLRYFTLDELIGLLKASAPSLIEISKEYIREGISLKRLAQELSQLCEHRNPVLAFAGTTDLVRCSGFSWDRYRSYLAVQIAQAKFLGCSLFRLLLGKASPNVSVVEVVQRVQDFCSDLQPIDACVEIHGGLESDPAVLAELLRVTPVKIVIDLENMYRTALNLDGLLGIVPIERVAYFHQRNLPGVWIEHRPSLDDESRCHRLFPGHPFLWEPKTVDDPERIQRLFCEYRTSH